MNLGLLANRARAQDLQQHRAYSRPTSMHTVVSDKDMPSAYLISTMDFMCIDEEGSVYEDDYNLVSELDCKLYRVNSAMCTNSSRDSGEFMLRI